ncbi:KEOPS complex subunit Pcc1 [Halomicrobium salinisoli]|uniref:KEOPS complex subunit Pcc1 n=1 Tax=Halomicrobium salinisoli TaxID=2878391 RepID=UPI001CF046D7|nr:KEOPS complex subunit Pcc1 [Halomicrobium salinisoli]
MNHEAVLSFAYDDAQRARRVADSVRPEVDEIAGDRTRATLELDGDAVTVTVEAEDLTALRAGLNTWQRLVAVAERAGDAAPA